MAVARSYENMPILCEPYSVNGRLYVKVDTGKRERQVRWYSDKEYARMYPDAVKIVSNKKDKNYKSQKEILGFQKGYITIFKGDTYSHLDWFRASICRYSKLWGWYVVSTEEVPEDCPIDLIPVTVEWNKISEDGENLSTNESKITQYIESLIYEPSTSEFIGEIKERLDLVLTVTKVLELEGSYGHSTLHTFEDEFGNIFVWTTSAKTLQEGTTYKMRGTVKDHKVYKNKNQTILTRCSNIEEV